MRPHHPLAASRQIDFKLTGSTLQTSHAAQYLPLKCGKPSGLQSQFR
jgi:hypothetical protein